MKLLICHSKKVLRQQLVEMANADNGTIVTEDPTLYEKVMVQLGIIKNSVRIMPLSFYMSLPHSEISQHRLYFDTPRGLESNYNVQVVGLVLPENTTIVVQP